MSFGGVDEKKLAEELMLRAEKLLVQLPPLLEKFASYLGAEVRYSLTNSEITFTIKPKEPKP